MRLVNWGRKQPRTPSAWTQRATNGHPLPTLDQFEAVLKRQTEAWLSQLRQLDLERRSILERVAKARQERSSDEERLAEDEHLLVSKRRAILLRHLWFIHDEYKQARLLRTILEDQAAKREIMSARREGSLEG
ncbi:MAG: hypothetical protein ACREA0_35145, partial [bacterium]